MTEKEEVSRTPRSRQSIELHLVGRTHLSNDMGRIVPLPRKDAALLATLAERPFLSRRRAAALLWSGVTDANASGNLRQRLFRLRRLAPGVLDEGRDGLRLGSSVQRIDPLARLADDPDACCGEWLGDWRYDDEPDLAEHVALARLQWAQRRRARLLDLADSARRDGHLDRALAYARRLLSLDPADEDAHREVMQVHLQRGEAAAAVLTFDACVSALAIGPRVEPNELTVRLVRSARARVPTARPVVSHPSRKPYEADRRRLSHEAQRLAAIFAELGETPSVSAVYRRFNAPAVLLLGAWQELEGAGLVSGFRRTT